MINIPSDGSNIIYVDDDDDLRQLVELSFRFFGDQEICACANGEEFLKLYRPGKFNLVLLDWQMPRLTGMDLANWVRSNIGDDRATIIFITARDCSGERQKLHDLKVAGVIDKPFEPELLPGLVDSIYMNRGAPN